MINTFNPDYSNTPVCSLRPKINYKPEDIHVKPVVSIISAFYNTDIVFHETAQSVFQQSLQQWEWIIINDGSTDEESLRILNGYRNIDPRVRIIDHTENKGLPAARNTGFREAESEYILYLDSDDLLEPTTAEKWYWYLEYHSECGFVGGYSVGFGAHEYLWQSGFQDMDANLEQNRIANVIMVRKRVLQILGGYDESMRGGLEDWEFWIRCAASGFWGNSIPEYLHWYRTREQHADRWDNLQKDKINAFREELHYRYPHLWKGGFPHIQSNVDLQLLQIEDHFPCENKLQKIKPRLLLIVPWLIVGGAEKFNLDLIKQLSLKGWEITIATTAQSDNRWQYEFEWVTPDVFLINNFVEYQNLPQFLSYLIQSRQVDIILVSASHEAYRLLPYIRDRFPQIPILDYNHFVTPDWMDGGFPRLSLLFQSSIDLSIVSCHQVKNWMVEKGVNIDRVQVCPANVDTSLWKPHPEKRKEYFTKLGIDENIPLILYVGRIEQQKQPQIFGKSIKKLSQKNLPFKALVVGNGSLLDWLKSYIKDECLQEYVKFLGEIPSDQVQELMSVGDIIFLPSKNEGIALTLYEGMASGLVPVGADVGGQCELVIPECGFLLPRGTVEEESDGYCNVLEKLLLHPHVRQQMSKASRTRVENYFRLDQMGDRMIDLFLLADRLRKENPRESDQKELAGLLARQSVEYMRVMKEEIRLDQIVNDYAKNLLPPAPARTYFYFAIRSMLLPIVGQFRNSKWLTTLKEKTKSLFVK